MYAKWLVTAKYIYIYLYQEIMREQLHSNRIAFCNEVETFMTTIGLQLLQPDHSAYNMEMQMINLKQKEKQLTKGKNSSSA